MLKRRGVVILGPLVAATTLLAASAQGPHPAKAVSDLDVHEWGTFTTVAGADGQAVQWRPLSGPADLPCFVTALNPNSFKTDRGGVPGLKATVRMETPVLYFYSPREQTVRAKVEFLQGVISEWYPQATVLPVIPARALASGYGSAEWADVRVTPGAKPNLPTDSGKSHYYAARETDAASLQVGSQQEKFLFYRGIANFPVPVSATVARDGTIAVKSIGEYGIGTFIMFERRGDRLGYRIVHAHANEISVKRPALTESVESLREALRGLLVEQGLYPREAAAMVETWRDSWFEDGARLFYLLPQATVDAILPLHIQPRPATISRVFVGRMEIVTPEIQTEVARAIRMNDRQTLRKYGRFLEPFSSVAQAQLSATHDEGKIENALRTIAAEHAAQPATCHAGAATTSATSYNRAP
jgi:hypothetical protein